MCEAPICHCHRKMPEPSLRIEVGKVYRTTEGSVVKILNKSSVIPDNFIGEVLKPSSSCGVVIGHIGLWNSYGFRSSSSCVWTLVSEYKEPEYWHIAIYSDGSTNCRDLETDLRHSTSKRLVKAIIRINKETYQVEQLPL